MPGTGTLQRFSLPAVLILLFAAQFGVARFLAWNDTAWVPPAEAAREKWNPRVIRFAALSHGIAAADLYWLRFLQNTGLSHVQTGRLSAAFVDLDAATDLDPAFFEAYASGAPALAVVRNDVDGAIRLIEKAERFATEDLPALGKEFRERHWGRRWWLNIVAAYLHLFERGDLASAARSFLEADGMPGAPEYIGRLAARLREPGGIYSVGMSVLRFLASKAGDEALRRRYDEDAFSLEVSRFVFGINREFEAFARSRAGESRAGAWKRFVDQRVSGSKDPWGGVLSIDRRGRVSTTTPRRRVFGID